VPLKGVETAVWGWTEPLEPRALEILLLAAERSDKAKTKRKKLAIRKGVPRRTRAVRGDEVFFI
jgi:hypothetical protein